MGLVNIDEDLHDQLRKAGAGARRSVSAQAAFWSEIGMLLEINPALTFNEIVARERQAAGAGNLAAGKALS